MTDIGLVTNAKTQQIGTTRLEQGLELGLIEQAMWSLFSIT
jgi:hypothetical protein